MFRSSKWLAGLLISLGLALWLPWPGAIAATPPSLTQIKTLHEHQPIPALLPLDKLMMPRQVLEVELSPDGGQLAYLKREKLGASLWLMDSHTLTHQRLFQSRDITGISWSPDSRTIVLKTTRGAAYVHRDGKAPRRILLLDPARHERLLGIARQGQTRLLLLRQEQQRHQLLAVDFQGREHLLYQGPFPIRDALLDARGEAAFVLLAETDHYAVHDLRGQAPTRILRCEIADECRLLAYQDGQARGAKTSGKDRLWLASDSLGNRQQLLSWQTVRQGFTSVHEDPERQADLATVQFDPQSQQPLLASYRGGQRRHYGLTPTVRQHLEQIRNLSGREGMQLTLSSGNAWLLHDDNSKQQHGRWYLYRPQQRQLLPILARQQGLDALIPPSQLAEIFALTYSASDGMAIHATLTLPRGRPLAQSPMITLVHGGPWQRNYARYSARIQLLANRGYIVFAPDFRGSSGYGRDYRLAARGEYEQGRVHSDIIEGIRYLLSQGIGDAAKLGIMGDSFGGYATLAALAYEPQLFRGGIAIASPPALYASFRRQHLAGKRYRDLPLRLRFEALIGNMDRPETASRSPNALRAQITSPLLMIAGGRDDRVDIRRIKDFASALHHQGNELSLLVDPDVGHRLGKPILRKANLMLMEAFWATHLGGGKLATADDELQRYLHRHLVYEAAGLAPAKSPL